MITTTSLGVIAGLALSRWWSLNVVGLWLCLPFLIFWKRLGRLILIIGLVFGLLVGLGRGHRFMAYLADYRPLFRHPVVLQAVADNDAIYTDKGELSFDVTHVTVQQPRPQNLKGKLKIEGFGASMVYRGDHLHVSGSLAPTQGSAQAKISFAKVGVTKRGRSWLDNFRRRFIAGLESVLPEPEAPFGAGLLLGQRSTIPKETNDQLSATGLTHLVAVSGYNLTIIIVAVRKLLGRASKFQSTLVAANLMLLFVLVTGLSASIVRAALVSSLSLLAWYYGRKFTPLLLISLTAAVTAFWNPFYLWADIGWYLSYLAFFGVLLIAPLTTTVLSHGKAPKLLGSLLGETTAAQVMTLPIIMYIFGRVSLIGLLANVLVVPLVPLAMLLSLLAGLAGMFSGPLGGWLAWPAKQLLTYMIDLVGLLSRLPHAAAQRSISLLDMLLMYVTILALSLLLWRFLASRAKLKYAKITE